MHDIRDIGRKINVVGTSGSGKSTLSRQLAEALGVQHIELDGLNHLADWQQNPHFGRDLAAALDANPDGWVVDGNYWRRENRDHVLQQADAIVWLDYPRWLCLWRITHRSLRRAITRETLWNGNRESLSNFLSWSEKSMFYWVWKTHAEKRERYSRLMVSGEHPHLQRVQLRSPRAATDFVNAIRTASTG